MSPAPTEAPKQRAASITADGKMKPIILSVYVSEKKIRFANPTASIIKRSAFGIRLVFASMMPVAIKRITVIKEIIYSP